MNNENMSFKYNYSAKEQAELKKIREKYTKDKSTHEISTIERVRQLDKKVTDKASVISLCIGIISALILGFAMSLIMTDIGDIFNIEIVLIPGIIIGCIGIAGLLSAYPIYQKVLIIERKKIAPEIIKLTDEIKE